MNHKEEIKKLLNEKKFEEAIKLIRKIIAEDNLQILKNKEYFTMMNNLTRAVLLAYEKNNDEKYSELFKNLYLEMMDNQRLARKEGFDITRYKNSYQKKYRELKN